MNTAERVNSKSPKSIIDRVSIKPVIGPASIRTFTGPVNSRMVVRPFIHLGTGLYVALVISLVLLAACGGGSGSSGSKTHHGYGIALLSITFPKCTDLSGAAKTPPPLAPLSQQVVLTFSGPVEGKVTPSGLRITADPGPDYMGPTLTLDKTKYLIMARGTFEVTENLVIFTPCIPTKAINLSPNALPEEVPGLLPGYTYQVFVPVGTQGSIANLVHIDPGVKNPVAFTTVPEDLTNLYFLNQPPLPPLVVASDPPNGTVDFGVNTLDAIPGFPENRDILLAFDQPIDFSEQNLQGCDLNGDGIVEPNLFLAFTEPVCYCAVDRIQGQPGFVARLDGGTDEFEFVGFTEYQGENVGLRSVIFIPPNPGEEPFKMVGCDGARLFDVAYGTPSGSPPVCPLSNERILNIGNTVRGLTASREGELYGLVDDLQILARIDLEDGSVEKIGNLPPGLGAFVDLCSGHDNEIYGLRVFYPGTASALCSVERIDRQTLQTTKVVSGLHGDYTSLGFARPHELWLFDARSLRRCVVNPADGAVKAFGLEIIHPLLEPGIPLFFDLKRLELGVNPVLESNAYQGAVVRISPSGLLPFGAWIDVMTRFSLRNLTGGSLCKHQGRSPWGAGPAAGLCTFDPGPDPIEDRFIETFTSHEGEEIQHEFDHAPAIWNVADPDPQPPVYQHLLAGYGFSGSGELGDFMPAFSPVFLDTDYQPLPLLNGATPGIQKPTVVRNGIFHFRDIVIPEGITVYACGTRPLVLTATGRVEVAGTIDVSGMPGTGDTNYDSAYLPTPGGPAGPGGGRGGNGQPTTPAQFTALTQLQSPPRGEQGWGPGNLHPIGGQGGESGANGTSVAWKPGQWDANSRGAGGGGGSYFDSGCPGYPGKGKYGVDGKGNFYVREPWDYWDGSYKHVPGWDPASGPPPESWKINRWFAAQGHRAPYPGDPGQLAYHEDSAMASLCLIDRLPHWPKSNGTDGYSPYHWELTGSKPFYGQSFPSTTECLVPPERTPSNLNSLSYAQSRWINLGQVVNRPPIQGIASPLFQSFEGVKILDDWAVVNTSPDGYVVHAHLEGYNDIEVDAPDLAQADFIPEDNEGAIQFQGTDAIAPGSKVPNEDPKVMSGWTPDLTSLSGRPFIRFRIRLDVARGTSLGPQCTKPQVNRVRIRVQY